MRLIDADAFATKMKERQDAVPVVLCENCKWWDKSSCGCTHPGHGFATTAPDYCCGDGERKGGEE